MSAPLLRPMLAAKLKPEQDLEDLPYPLYASPKIDAIRGLVGHNQLLSRTVKEIPNIHTQYLFRRLPYGFDGELAVGETTHPNLMQRSMSGLMSVAGEPEVTFNLFDTFAQPALPYWKRLAAIEAWYTQWALMPEYLQVRLVKQTLVHSAEELYGYEQTQLRAGYEGVIVRTPTSKYKFGRSTLREGYLIKLKRYSDAEAVVVDFEELLHNENEAELDERGYTKRSSHASGKVAAGTLGTLICRDLNTSQIVRLGTGFTAAERDDIWANRARYVGLCVTYKHFSVTGVVSGRRQPVFKCFRDLRDIV